MTVQLTKHHVLANDFLIVLDGGGQRPADDEVRFLCARRRGIGADGLIVATRTGDRFAMELRNADASRAEMSGNGIACLAQALVVAGWAAGPSIAIDTEAGPRTVEVLDQPSPTTHRLRVDMGRPVIGDDLPEWVDGAVRRAVAVDVGNPHVVAHVATLDDAPDVATFGARIDAATPGGTNVHLVAPGASGGQLVMRTFERGVGPTEACGTGTVAVAAAAAHWGIAGRSVTLHQPGGDAAVELDGDRADLVVVAHLVATVEPARGCRR